MLPALGTRTRTLHERGRRLVRRPPISTSMLRGLPVVWLRASSSASRDGGRDARERNGELATLADAVAARCDATAVQFNKTAHDVQADTESAATVGGFLHEQVEDMRESTGGDAFAVVQNANGRDRAVCQCGQRNVSAIIRILRGIRQQVGAVRARRSRQRCPSDGRPLEGLVPPARVRRYCVATLPRVAPTQ